MTSHDVPNRSRSARRWTRVLAATLLALATVQARAATFTVTNTTDTVAGSLRAAVNLANAAGGADTIVFDSGVFNTPRTITLASGPITISSPITITGPGADLLTLVGTSTTRLFNVNGGAALTLSGVTLSGGNAPSNSGGGAIASSGNLTLTGCAVRNCTAQFGGGIYVSDGYLSMTGCEISGNSATQYAGGIQVLSNASSTGVVLTNCTFKGNSAPDSETTGGLDLFPNTANTAIFASVVNCTFAENNADGALCGGAICCNSGAGFAQVTLRNNLFAANSNPQIRLRNFGQVASAGNNLSSDASGNLTQPTDKINTDPRLGLFARDGGTTNCYTLLPGSPAMDAGANTGLITTDQRGLPRAVASLCGAGAITDIGAVETQRYLVTNLNDTGDGSLRWAVEDNNAAGGGVICINTTGTLPLTGGQLPLTQDVALSGPGADQFTIDAANGDRIFQIPAGVTAAMSGLSLYRGGRNDLVGGGFYVEGGSLTLTDCAIRACVALQGGGILSSNSKLTLVNCELSNCVAGSFAGGIMSISQGAGASATAALTNCTLSGNTMLNPGNRGGALFCFANGGSQTATLTHCTVANNNGGPAPSDAGGIVSWFNTGTLCRVELKNTIVAANTNVQCAVIGAGQIVSAGGNLSSDATANLVLSSDRPNTNPLLGPLAFNGGPTKTHALLAGSPAIDAAAADLTAQDQRALPRPRGCGLDIGAVEFQSGAPHSGDFDGNGVGVSDVAPFIAAVLDPTSNRQGCIADVNVDGQVNGRDVQAFITDLTNP